MSSHLASGDTQRLVHVARHDGGGPGFSSQHGKEACVTRAVNMCLQLTARPNI